ncbi:hypothetical protein PENTCL1PPCAC_5339 [Pristionchus entomophagus]|uniref:Uncharacterized protein n=1 Tax=Pristionchus entomophagus TaxID=358040 RepID=A0AAV5SJS7_9BILA|nr:hypothetical protein PENTCL1PPCAC_5339 [Pristionchus entomophagus]
MGFEGDSAVSIKYVGWLDGMRRGLDALAYYNADTKAWTSAHEWAYFVLMKVVLEAGQGCITIQNKDSAGRATVSISLDKTKIDSVAKPAVMEFLKKLQAYKSTADVNGATVLFDKYSVDAADLERDKIYRGPRKRRFRLWYSRIRSSLPMETTSSW